MRNLPIDAVRGAVMVLMALDHVRYYFTDRQFPPEDLALTTLGLFLTRWVTHFCAPAFFFLAGASAFLAGTRPRKLVLRGVMLIVLELTIVGFAWTFRPGFSLGGVIWALGWSMILLAVPAVWKPAAFIAVPVIVLHELLPPMTALHTPGMIGGWFVLYPLVPWFAVMFLGYQLGPWFRDGRNRALLFTGFAATAAFAFLGADLNQEKYPPSVAYLLMTLGPMLAALAVIRRAPRWLVTFGRVPLFFYVAHLFVIHGAAYVAARVSGQPHQWLGWGGWFPRLPPDGYGYGLPVVWGVTALVVFALYWPSAWWERRRSGIRAERQPVPAAGH